jgi:hypothetical protein
MKNGVLAGLIILILGTQCLFAQQRTWTHKNGRQEVGVLIDVTPEYLVIRRESDGRLCKAQLSSLVAADEEFVAANAAKIQSNFVMRVNDDRFLQLDADVQSAYRDLATLLDGLKTEQGLEAEVKIVEAFAKKFLPTLERALGELNAIKANGTPTQAQIDISAAWILNGKMVVRDAVAAHARKSPLKPYNPAIVGDIQKVLNTYKEKTCLAQYANITKKEGEADHGYVAWLIPKMGDVQYYVLQDAAQTKSLPPAQLVSTHLKAFQGDIGRAEQISKQGWNTTLRQDEELKFNATMADINRVLIEPLDLPSFDRWIVSPAADIWLVPFSAVKTDNNSYAIEENYHISYVLTGRDLLVAAAAKPAPRKVLLANPYFDGAPSRTPSNLQLTSESPLYHLYVAHLGDLVNCLGAWGLQFDTWSYAVTPALSTGLFCHRHGRFGFRSRCSPCPSVPGAGGQGGTLGGELPSRYDDDPYISSRLSDLATTIGALIGLPEGSPSRLEQVNATEPAFRLATRLNAADPSVVVICTHGFFVAGKPKAAPKDPLLNCGVALTGANEALGKRVTQGIDIQRIDANDGLLFGREIVAMKQLEGVDLVFLVACESGVGEIVGNQLASLRHAFTLAGCNRVVGTSWQVPLDESKELSELFFKNRAAKHPADESLRSAQRVIVKSLKDKEGSAHPYFWAGFSLTGQTR